MRILGTGLGPELITLCDEGLQYRRLLAREFVRMWRTHPDVWQMHILNRQFTHHDGVNAWPATLHCVAQALRGEVLASLLGLENSLQYLLVKAILLTDSYKAEERRYMKRVGPSWDSYAEAQRRAHESWVASEMFAPIVLTIASSVAHESLLAMEVLCAKRAKELPPFAVAQLAAHYVDDISRNHDWVEPAAEDGTNMIQRRMRQNASNPVYAQLNEEGRVRLRAEAEEAGLPYFTAGETTYEAQARVGTLVEECLARTIMQYRGIVFRPIDLPVIIDNTIRPLQHATCPIMLCQPRMQPGYHNGLRAGHLLAI